MSQLPLTVGTRIFRSDDHTAVRDGEDTYSYRLLDQRVSQLELCLRRAGVRHGDAVVVGLERGFDWVSSTLALLRMGAAYVPVDDEWGGERLRFIISDSGARVVIARNALLSSLGLASYNFRAAAPSRSPQDLSEPMGFDPQFAPTQEEETSLPSSAEEGTSAGPDSLAYIIYTSGSTGLPKGVEITHANLNHLIDWHLQAFDVTEKDVASHVAGLGFDAAGWEVWPYLVAGSTLTMPDNTVRTSPDLLREWMVEQGVTIGFAPTALAKFMITTSWAPTTSLRYLLTGGETLHHQPTVGLPFTVVNNYGPTECTVVATSGSLLPGSVSRPTIGKPILGTAIYILEKDGTPVQNGQPGEIVIGGPQVARGYKNLPELTQECFAPDPFSALPGARMYRTGDLGRRMEDGSIHFLGRADRQVKIRGQRVELEEIEVLLSQHPQVRFATVVARNNGDGDLSSEKSIVAYILPQEDSADAMELSVSELQKFMLARVPSYMLPSMYVRLSDLPLTPNGKVDEKRLPPPSQENALQFQEAAVRGPRSILEERLLDMVRALLHAESVTVEDDFFLVGGHSLLGTQLVLRVRAAFGVEMPLRALFEAPTVESLALVVEQMMRAELEAMTDEDAERLSAGVSS